MLDWLIENATIVDGIRGECQGDVGIQGDTISGVLPPKSGAQARKVLNAQGMLLTPGFIDIHRHGDLQPFQEGPWDELPQGITTMISGNCGFSPVPNAPHAFEAMRAYAQPILGRVPDWVCGLTTRAYYRRVASQPLEVNWGSLAGGGDLRRSVTGFSNAPLTRKAMARIQGFLEDAFEAGSLGLSMGLMYTPECYYTREELIALAQVAARWQRPVITHIRGEGASVVDSVQELIDIGARSGAHVHISHLKAAGRPMWGQAVDAILDSIRRARQQGVRLTFDAYPYTAGSTTLLSLLPPEALTEGAKGVLKQLQRPDDRKALLQAFKEYRKDWDNLILSLGWGSIRVAGSSESGEVGRSIQELAEAAGVPAGEFALTLLAREQGNVPIILEQTAPEDVKRIILQEGAMVISDALYSDAGRPHPRKYGAFHRFLCQYVTAAPASGH